MPKIITLTIPDEFVGALEEFLDSEANDAFEVDEVTKVRSRKRRYKTIDELFEEFTRGRLAEIAQRFPSASMRRKLAERAMLDKQITEQATPPRLRTDEESK